MAKKPSHQSREESHLATALLERRIRRKALISLSTDLNKNWYHSCKRSLSEKHVREINFEINEPLPFLPKKSRERPSPSIEKIQTDTFLISLAFSYPSDLRETVIDSLIERLPDFGDPIPQPCASREFWLPILQSPLHCSSKIAQLFCSIIAPLTEDLSILINFPNQLVGEKVLEPILSAATSSEPLESKFYSMLVKLSTEFPFPIRNLIATSPFLNWRMLPNLLERGLPLHSRNALDLVDWNLFKKRATDNDLRTVKKYLDRLRSLSSDLTDRFQRLT